jgi:hypothetical protein
MDYNNKVIYADSLLLFLEMYLGKEHKFYQFRYIKQNFEQRQIMPDVVSGFKYKTVNSITRGAYSNMIYAGKELYLKDLCCQTIVMLKNGYTSEQIKCDENESYMWRYFIEKELLYSVDQKLIPRFINMAPFSKFYLEIDNETRVG